MAKGTVCKTVIYRFNSGRRLTLFTERHKARAFLINYFAAIYIIFIIARKTRL